MTPKSLFNLILKVFGLFFLREIVYLIPQLVSIILSYTETNDLAWKQFNIEENISIIITVFAILFYAFIIYQLLFNTNKIIDILKLDQEYYQKEFSFNLSNSQILTISLIVIGAIILLNEIPNFLTHIFSLVIEKKYTHNIASFNYSYLVSSGIKIIIALLIIGERKRIIEFIQKSKQRSK